MVNAEREEQDRLYERELEQRRKKAAEKKRIKKFLESAFDDEVILNKREDAKKHNHRDLQHLTSFGKIGHFDGGPYEYHFQNWQFDVSRMLEKRCSS